MTIVWFAVEFPAVCQKVDGKEMKTILFQIVFTLSVLLFPSVTQKKAESACMTYWVEVSFRLDFIFRINVKTKNTNNKKT